LVVDVEMLKTAVDWLLPMITSSEAAKDADVNLRDSGKLLHSCTLIHQSSFRSVREEKRMYNIIIKPVTRQNC
jgi:hypothetical protein